VVLRPTLPIVPVADEGCHLALQGGRARHVCPEGPLSSSSCVTALWLATVTAAVAAVAAIGPQKLASSLPSCCSTVWSPRAGMVGGVLQRYTASSKRQPTRVISIVTCSTLCQLPGTLMHYSSFQGDAMVATSAENSPPLPVLCCQLPLPALNPPAPVAVPASQGCCRMFVCLSKFALVQQLAAVGRGCLYHYGAWQ
jgi:hypothetical protein